MHSGENKVYKARRCPQCKQAFPADVSFCPDDGSRLSEELSVATSSEMFKFTGSTATGKKRGESEKQSPAFEGKVPPENASHRGPVRERPESRPKRPEVLDLSQELNLMPGRAENRSSQPGHAPGETTPPAAKNRDGVVHSLVGQTLDNQYEILSIIGQGGMSVVYKARHVMLRKIVAIKTLLPHLVLHPLSLQRFQQEAQAASNIVHTNVVTIYNFGITPEGQPYLVMDYLEGVSLQDLISQNGHLPIERALKIFLQVANALGLAHERGVIHRDLKPSNIILIEQGDKKDIVQLVDFGIAKLLPQEGAESIALTQTGEVFGSPLYMSPEQAKGEKLDARSDIYSMGCLMYETLSGRPPHNGENALEVLYKHINDVPPAMSHDEVKIPHALEAIVFRCLTKSPDLRYQNMLALEEDLESFQKARQFSLIGILRSRWELTRLKKAPRTRGEKLAQKMALIFALLATVGIGYPAVSFWGMADAPAAKQPLKWEDGRGEVIIKPDDRDLMATALVNTATSNFLKHPNLQDFGEWFGMCTRAGKKCIDQGMYEEAVNLISKAIVVAGRYADAGSVPMIIAYQERADAYYNMGNFKEAAKDVDRLIQLYDIESHHGLAEQTAEIARLGDCYYFMEQYQLAASCYGKAIGRWFRSDQPSKEYASEFGLHSIPKLDVVALCYSRLGEIYQKAASQEIRHLGVENSYEEYGHAVRLFYQALPIWRQAQGDGSKNVSLCELHLAEVLPRYQQPDLTRVANIAGGDKWAQVDKDPESLFTRAEKGIASAYGKAHPYYAIALLKHAQYRASQHDLTDYIKLRLQACAILSSKKD